MDDACASHPTKRRLSNHFCLHRIYKDHNMAVSTICNNYRRAKVVEKYGKYIARSLISARQLRCFACLPLWFAPLGDGTTPFTLPPPSTLSGKTRGGIGSSPNLNSHLSPPISQPFSLQNKGKAQGENIQGIGGVKTAVWNKRGGRVLPTKKWSRAWTGSLRVPPTEGWMRRRLLLNRWAIL